MAGNRQVGGLWCFDVLARLSDFVDGELAQAERERVEAHLRGCDECTRFGGEFGWMVRAMRRALGAATGSLPPDVDARLKHKLPGA
jgi:anti-sigma factor RsiW